MRSTKLWTLTASAAATFAGGMATSQESKPTQLSLQAEQYQAVVCLLPGRTKKLGGLLTYVERRRAIETTARDCEIRGGEYTVYDRANYQTALEVWKRAAETEADPEARAKAQTYVGEIYEKSLGTPDYAGAAQWYQQAADSGSMRAKLHLAYLYENGLGVERDLARSLALWRDGMGIEEDLVFEGDLVAARTEAQRQIDELTAELERQNRTTQQFQELLATNAAQLDAQKSTLAAARRDIASLTQQLEAERSKPTGNTEQLAALQKQITEKTNVANGQQTRIALLETQLSAQRAQLDASASAAAIHEQQLQQALDSVARQEAETASLTETLASRDAEIRSLERQIKTANIELDGQRNRQKNLETELARLNTGATTGSAERAQTAAQMAALQKQLDDSRRDVAARQGEIEQMRQSVAAERATFEESLRNAKVTQTELQADLERLRSERAALEGQSAGKDEEVATMRNRISDMNTALAAQELEAERLRAQLTDAQRTAASAAQRAAADAEVAGLKQQLATKEGEIAKQAASIEQMHKEWLAAKGDADSLRQQLSAEGDSTAMETKLRAQLGMLERDIVAATTERDRLEMAVSQERREKELLRQERASAEQALAEAQMTAGQNRDRMAALAKQLNDELAAKDQAIAAKDQVIMGLTSQLREQSLEAEGLFSERNYVAANVTTRSFAPGPSVKLPKDVDMTRYSFHALIIGNWDYTYINDLRTVEADVNTVKTLLEQRYKFDVDLRTNLTLDQMYGELNKLGQYGENDFVLIYYAGHGTLDQFNNGYWQPVDFEPGKDPSVTAVSVTQITQHLNMMKAKHVMIIADSCYSGALLRENTVEINNAEQRLKHWVNNASRTVLTSGGLSPVLDSGDGTHSVFAKAFVDVLADNRDILSGETLHSRISNTIRTESRQLNLEQNPQFAGLADAGHANGEFVFLPQ